jgi:hypothetical protein
LFEEFYPLFPANESAATIGLTLLFNFASYMNDVVLLDATEDRIREEVADQLVVAAERIAVALDTTSGRAYVTFLPSVSENDTSPELLVNDLFDLVRCVLCDVDDWLFQSYSGTDQ